ncbi:MAG: hypothetical protein V4580_08655 [Bacteroidota bacterium]
MKKMMMLAIASSGFVMASCNKNYNCYCNQQLNNQDTVMIYVQKERSAKKAKQACENLSDSSGNCSLNK